MSLRPVSICALLLLVFASAYLRAEVGQSPQTAVAQVTEVERLVVQDTSPPSDFANWEPYTLPQYFGEIMTEDFDTSMTVWFRYPVAQHWVHDNLSTAIYLPRHNMTMSVYLDDRYLGGTDEPVRGLRPIGWNHPLLLDLPVTEDSRYIYFEVKSGPSGALLAPFYIAPRPALQDMFDARHALQITGIQLALGTCLLMALLSFWIWNLRREDRLYLRFSLLSFCYCIPSAFGFLPFIPFDLRTWHVMVYVASDWASYLLVTFVTLALNIRADTLTRALFILASIATVLHFVVPDRLFLQTAFPFLAVQDLLVAIFGLYVIWRVFQRPLTADAWFGVAFIGMFIFKGHDFYGVFLSTPEEHALGTNWMHLSLPFMAIAFFAHLLSRFVNALETSERLNRELEEAAQEKARIYRDLHDDVGAKLLSIIHEDRDDSSSLAREALESIRSTIYSVNHGDATLGRFTDELIGEMDIRLTSAGIDVSHNRTLEQDFLIESKVAYHITRILREVVNNILNHAGASFVFTNVQCDAQQFRFEVDDDGEGISPAQLENTGLNNIRYRARAIGAEVDLVNTDSGTRFTLTIPVNR